MEPKRFLTADEVFQLFGVDSQALDGLVESGAVKALADRGSFKYRSEDFANLVQEGKLTPRTSGEQFQVDDKGDMPFLKLKDEERGIKFDEDVSFIELDEEALNAQAQQGEQVSRTPVVPDKWFDDSDESVDSVPAVEVPVSKKPSDATDVEVTSGHADDKASDSDVQVFDDNAGIDYDEPDVAPSASDSDVRLEGPVTSPAPSSIVAKKRDSDSDVRLATVAGGKPKSDSDVTIAPTKKSDGSTIAQHGASKPDSDSDVQLAAPVPGSKPDSDSDVRLSETTVAQSDSDVRFGEPDSGISLEPANTDSGITLEPVAADSGISLVPVPDSGITLQMSKTDSDIKLEPDSGISLDAGGDSGITLQSSMEGDSGISLMDGDSNIRLQSSGDSGIMLATGDSGITFAESPGMDSSEIDSNQTQTLNSPSSSFDVSVHEEERTMEMPLGGSSTEFSLLPEEGEESAKPKSSPKLAPKSSPKSAPLSDSIDLDESLEVEELDISEDLDSVSSGEFSGEFAEAEPEEVLEASDDDFSAHDGELEEVEEISEDEDYKPAAKVRSGPREPAWGMGAVIPIACSALLMAVCVTVLWGGISTMWTGAEPGGPAGILMSSLAGLPF